ncbi:MAG: hypothetical protein Q8P59_01920 [Dehalococcoidia bacterium]|nr:hypothetical protein [Dehalococcoidia bacterium]
MSNREQLREQIEILLEEAELDEEFVKDFIDSILALPNLEVRAEDQTLPIDFMERDTDVYKEGQQDMLDVGFVRVEVKP